MTPVKRKLSDKLVQYHEQQLLREVGTKANGPRSIFGKKLAIRKAATEDDLCTSLTIRAVESTLN